MSRPPLHAWRAFVVAAGAMALAMTVCGNPAPVVTRQDFPGGVVPGGKTPVVVERETLRIDVLDGLRRDSRNHCVLTPRVEVRAEYAIRPVVLSLLLVEEDAQEIQYARKLIESDIVAMVVQRATPEDYKIVEETLESMQKALDAGESIYEHTWEFHRALAHIGGNRVLATLLEVLYRMIRELQIEYYEPYIDPRQEIESHRMLLHRLKTATPDEARQLIRDHLDDVDDVMLPAMARQVRR